MPKKAKYEGTALTPRQWEVVKMRAAGMTQAEVAKKLHTTRENVCIIERRARSKIRAAKATIVALQDLAAGKEMLLPSGTSVFEAVSSALVRADVLGIKLAMSADGLLAALRSKCKGRIRGHHLTAMVKLKIKDDGSVVIS